MNFNLIAIAAVDQSRTNLTATLLIKINLNK